MDFSLFQEFDPGLKAQWNNLLTNGISRVPFLRFDYLKTWWQTRGGGEWPQESSLMILGARQADEIIGFAPFFLDETQGGKVLRLLGSVEISDYLDLLVTPAHVRDFSRELLKYANSTLKGQFGIDRIEFSNVADHSPTLDALAAASQELGITCTTSVLNRSPYIPLSGNYEEYLESLDKKQRHEMRRKMRRIMELPEGSEWYIAKDPATIENEIAGFLRLMEFDENKREFLTPAMREQMRLSMLDAFRHNILQLAFLTIGGEKAAAYLNFDFNNRIWVYNSGIDPQFYEHSPGWVLLIHLIKWAIENNRFEFDFMRGNEDYKYKFGAVDRSVMQSVVEL